MSKYTTSIRNWCESIYQKNHPDSEIPVNISAVIADARDEIFNFPFETTIREPNQFRNLIIEKILKHFYFREIGFETVGMFRIRLNDRMQTVMPTIVELYEFKTEEGQKIFSLYDSYEQREVDEETDGKNSKKFTGENKMKETTLDKQKIETVNSNQHLENDTPQNGIPAGWSQTTYLSGYSADNNTQTRRVTNISDTDGGLEHWRNDDTSNSENGTNSGTRKLIEKIYRIGDPEKHYAFLNLMEQKLISIDTILFEALEPLFMQIW